MWWLFRSVGDTVNFLGLEITQTSRGFEVEKRTELVETIVESLRTLEIECQSWQTLYSDGARDNNSSEWSRFLQLSHSRRKTHLHGTLETRHAIRHPTTIHTSPQYHNGEQARSETFDTISQKHAQHNCLRLEPHMTVQIGMNELVGRSDSDWAGDSATRQSVTGYHCNFQEVMLCNRSLKQTAISLSSCEAEFNAGSLCAGKLLGLAELFKELHCNVSVHLELDSDSARHILQREGPDDSSTVDKRKKDVHPLNTWIRKTTEQISSRRFWMDHERSGSQGSLDDTSLEARTTESLTTASSRAEVQVFSSDRDGVVQYTLDSPCTLLDMK